MLAVADSVCVCIPTYDTSILVPGLTEIVKWPSRSVMAPVADPGTLTVAPMTGSPLASKTVPEKCCCCAHREEVTSKADAVKKVLILFMFVVFMMLVILFPVFCRFKSRDRLFNDVAKITGFFHTWNMKG